MNRRAALMVGVVATLLAAEPAAATIGGGPRGERVAARVPTMATGLGTRDDALQYVSIPPAAFAPMMSTETYAVGAVATLAKAIAPVSLPDGARIRELSCFGRWQPAQNSGKRMWLHAVPLADISGKEVIAKLTVGHGDGERRLAATADSVVDNFANAYQLVGSFNVQAELRGCRIGYVL